MAVQERERKAARERQRDVDKTEKIIEKSRKKKQTQASQGRKGREMELMENGADENGADEKMELMKMELMKMELMKRWS